MSKELSIVIVSTADNQAATSALQNELMLCGHSVANVSNFVGIHEVKSGNGILQANEDGLFNMLTLEVGMADLVVLCAPLDHDAVCLAGMAHISGIPVAFIPEQPQLDHQIMAVATGLPADTVRNDLQSLSFTVRGCVSFWCDDLDYLRNIIEAWPNLEEE